MYKVDKDAWSSGQIGSKQWLCEKLEPIIATECNYSPKIALLGGWYGMTAFLLLNRNNIDIKYIRSFDLDPTCEAIADMINENWVFDSWKFKAMTGDINSIDFSEFDIIINTSTEHIDGRDWFDKLHNDQIIAIQSNNMPHDDHIFVMETLKDFQNEFPLNNLYSGELKFKYPTWKFSRWMNIGKKF